MVGIVKDPLYLEHDPGDYHPESPDRLGHIYSMLPSIDGDGVLYVTPRMATHQEVALIHDASYIESIARTEGCTASLDPDTSTSPRTYEASLLAAGGCLSLADSILSGVVRSGFALIRPPGHHAERSRAMGFCIFNNMAIAARYLQGAHGAGRILIVDLDLHHGNGTQHSFYSDPSVLYFSTHQFPYYPGTGWYEETGQGDGAGYTVNVPLSYGMNDDDYLFVLREVLLPVADLFQPDMVLVSAGFDTHRDDPLGGMSVTEGGYSAMTEIVLDIARKWCRSMALFALEGGYEAAGLARSVKAVITTMKGEPAFERARKDKPCPGVVEVVTNVKRVLSPFWGKL